MRSDKPVKGDHGVFGRLLKGAGDAVARRKRSELTGSDDDLYAALEREYAKPPLLGLSAYFRGEYAEYLPRAIGVAVKKDNAELIKALSALMSHEEKETSGVKHRVELTKLFSLYLEKKDPCAEGAFSGMSSADRNTAFFAERDRSRAEFIFGLIRKLMASQIKPEQLAEKMTRYIELSVNDPALQKQLKKVWDADKECRELTDSKFDAAKCLLAFWDGEESHLQEQIFFPGEEQPTTFKAIMDASFGFSQVNDLADDHVFLARLMAPDLKDLPACKRYIASVPAVHHSRAFLLALGAENFPLAERIFSSIADENKLCVFLSDNADVSAKVFDFFETLRHEKQLSFPDLRQEHLNEQMAKYAEAIGNPKLAECIRKQTGFCHAWSHALGASAVLCQGPWWDAARLCLSVWPGDAASLEQAVLLPGDETSSCLKDVLGKVAAPMIENQNVPLGPEV